MPPDHGRANLALLQRGLRVLATVQRGKHDLRAGCRRREDRVESGVASGTGNRLRHKSRVSDQRSMIICSERGRKVPEGGKGGEQVLSKLQS